MVNDILFTYKARHFSPITIQFKITKIRDRGPLVLNVATQCKTRMTLIQINNNFNGSLQVFSVYVVVYNIYDELLLYNIAELNFTVPSFFIFLPRVVFLAMPIWCGAP
jgi:hypothetical protein